MKRSLIRLLASSIVALGLLAGAFAPSAQAVTCSGYGCDNLSPVTTGCSSGATTFDTKDIYDGNSTRGQYLGTVELRYSALCNTMWSRTTVIYCGYNYSAKTHNQVFRWYDGNGSTYSGVDIHDYPMHCSSDGGPSSSYGHMLYSPGGHYFIRARGQIDFSYPGYTGYTYTIWD